MDWMKAKFNANPESASEGEIGFPLEVGVRRGLEVQESDGVSFGG
jgi:hypothetical protein